MQHCQVMLDNFDVNSALPSPLSLHVQAPYLTFPFANHLVSGVC